MLKYNEALPQRWLTTKKRFSFSATVLTKHLEGKVTAFGVSLRTLEVQKQILLETNKDIGKQGTMLREHKLDEAVALLPINCLGHLMRPKLLSWTANLEKKPTHFWTTRYYDAALCWLHLKRRYITKGNNRRKTVFLIRALPWSGMKVTWSKLPTSGDIPKAT